MATNFPTSLDSLTNPTASDKLNSVTVPHASQHADINDAVEALEAKVGVDGSAVTTSHDYLIDKQSVVPYDDASARTTAVPSPIEGQMSYLKDTNSVEVYDGSAWTAVGGGVGTSNFTDTETGTYSSGGKNYKYLTFTASGTITIDTAGLADILVIGGGGGGGNASAGGGGAGGMLEGTGVYLPVGTLTVVVGAGGAAPAATNNNSVRGLTGIASSIDGVYFAPGGAGGMGNTRDSGNISRRDGYGDNGGSGSGAGPERTGGAGISGLGNDGGDSTASNAGGGGGGGAGAAGQDGTATGVAGNGGNGRSSSITGSAVTYAGGGGGGGTSGGAGGSSIGGDGGSSPTAGTANTGSGGGSNSGTALAGGGAGGSGIVVVRVEV